MSARRPSFSQPTHEPSLLRADRRARGVYYTPPEIVRLIADLTLTPLLSRLKASVEPPKILDLACGAGEFLIEAYRRLRTRFGAPACGQSIYGADIDPAAVAVARNRLQNIENSTDVIQNLRVGDALDPALFEVASFDVVLGNPPYVNIRQLAKALSRGQIDDLRSRYVTARGNFDLYVLFIERAITLLRPGGRCGLIVPNKWATLDYARVCRELLLAETTIEHVVDLSDLRPFTNTCVYPQVLVFRKEAAGAGHVVSFRPQIPTTPRYDRGAACQVLQHSLSPRSISFSPELNVESRVPTVPVGELAKLSCGTAGYAAQRIANLLQNAAPGDFYRANTADFITSGNIDRYAITPGNVRYLNQSYKRPRLPLRAPELTDAKRQLFSQPKIVVAGMSRRLEAAWDSAGLALGVQVFAVSDFQVDPFYLLALLNSKLLSYLFATRFAAKRLGGGYLAINKGQLARLPIAVGIPVPASREDGPSSSPNRPAFPATGKRLAELAKKMSCQPTSLRDAAIDQLVYEAYRLSPTEIARIETHFSGPIARAA